MYGSPQGHKELDTNERLNNKLKCYNSEMYSSSGVDVHYQHNSNDAMYRTSFGEKTCCLCISRIKFWPSQIWLNHGLLPWRQMSELGLKLPSVSWSWESFWIILLALHIFKQINALWIRRQLGIWKQESTCFLCSSYKHHFSHKPKQPLLKAMWFNFSAQSVLHISVETMNKGVDCSDFGSFNIRTGWQISSAALTEHNYSWTIQLFLKSNFSSV